MPEQNGDEMSDTMAAQQMAAARQMLIASGAPMTAENLNRASLHMARGEDNAASPVFERAMQSAAQTPTARQSRQAVNQGTTSNASPRTASAASGASDTPLDPPEAIGTQQRPLGAPAALPAVGGGGAVGAAGDNAVDANVADVGDGALVASAPAMQNASPEVLGAGALAAYLLSRGKAGGGGMMRGAMRGGDDAALRANMRGATSAAPVPQQNAFPPPQPVPQPADRVQFGQRVPDDVVRSRLQRYDAASTTGNSPPRMSQQDIAALMDEAARKPSGPMTIFDTRGGSRTLQDAIDARRRASTPPSRRSGAAS